MTGSWAVRFKSRGQVYLVEAVQGGTRRGEEVGGRWQRREKEDEAVGEVSRIVCELTRAYKQTFPIHRVRAKRARLAPPPQDPRDSYNDRSRRYPESRLCRQCPNLDHFVVRLRLMFTSSSTNDAASSKMYRITAS